MCRFGFSTLGALPLAAVTVLVGLTLPLLAEANIQEVGVVPPQPSMCDSVSFHVTGYFTDGCWHYDGYDVTILPTMGPFTAYMMRILCHREDGAACPLVIVPYEVSHDLGTLSPGPYTLLVVEVDSQDSTTFYDQRGISFSVSESCGPVEPCVLPGFTPSQQGCNAVVYPGRPGFLTVTLTNSMPVAGAEMFIEDIQQFRDEYCGSGSRCGFMTRVIEVEPIMRAFDMGVDWTFSGNKLHFMLHPFSSDPRETSGLPVIEPGDGPVARVWLEVVVDSIAWATPIPEVTFDVILTPVAFADEYGQSIPACPTFAPINGTVCIRNAVKCDVNGDGRADVVDIVRMIQCIMCPIPEGCCSPEEIARADCNGDNVLNVTDVVCCIRHILDFSSYRYEEEQARDPETLGGAAAIGLSSQILWENDSRFSVPLTFSSSKEVGGVEAWIRYDPTVLSVDGLTLSESLSDSELFFSASEGVLSFMIVDVEGGSIPSGDRILGEVSFVCKAATGGETELIMEGAAAADGEGARLDIVVSGKGLPVTIPYVPTACLASRPNPFHNSADISLSVVREQKGLLAVYDVSGRLVRTLHEGNLSPGVNTFSWDGRNGEGLEAGAGIYFLRFEGEREALTRKLVLLRH
ncbi:MAG: hypothetical protein AMJ46_11620 [Latescibacteria bacterium DG_63]|nr:MAG: hypothetical protein AMJ46_11620 [Latescibacteria bacterium DG_63]